ncbi:5-formyltetrahydrofolate cyclo-ligase [Prescottella equi]|nr:5-formyltetrahydrofolate cyclo-ligase [Prescottella equi]
MAVMNSLSKAEWRAHVLRERRAVSSGTRAAEARALAATAVSAAGSTAPAGATVCAYVPVGSEPGSIEMLDALRAAGLRVLLPVTGEPGPLEWAEFTGAEGLAAAGHGLQEPFGPVLPAGEVASASVIFVPALAVDERGTRLGRGAGFYDRTLGYADPGAALVAVVRDCELVPTLPADPHDVRMHYALTPGRGLVRLRDE